MFWLHSRFVPLGLAALLAISQAACTAQNQPSPAGASPAARSAPPSVEAAPTPRAAVAPPGSLVAASATGGAAATAAPPPSPPSQSPAPAAAPSEPPPAVDLSVTTIASGLDTPWALAFAPDGRLFVSERPGRIRLIDANGLQPRPVATLPVQELAEAGLMGLALDPGFPNQPYLYAMYTYAGAGGVRSRVVRLRLEDDQAAEETVILDEIPANSLHAGGRIKFGPDGLLYVTTGDVTSPSRAQDPNDLAGKLLRLRPDGSVPPDNPFGSLVYSLGHRNSQGLASQPGTGRLYATEHGPSGGDGPQGLDEINLIEKGANYGWPLAMGPGHPAPFTEPLRVYVAAIAPAGATFYNGEAIPQWRGSLFFATLRGTSLRRLVPDPADPRQFLSEDTLYAGQFGRLRDVAQGPDGALYFTTSNRDGRGRPAPDDDRVLRIGPA